MLKSLSVFSGNAHRELANAICAAIEVRPGESLVSTFSDGEIFVEIRENVRGSTASLCSRPVRRSTKTSWSFW